jgi:DNA-binding NarL/FixJ family response regulator
MTYVEPTPAGRSEPASGVVEVLLIEDNPVDAFMIEAMLSETFSDGVSCTRVDTLSEGLAVLTESDVSCVLLDLNLPDSEGLGTLDAVLVAGTEPAVVVLTGLNHDQTGRAAMARGAQDYLEKGKTDAGTLARAINHAVARKGVERDRRQDAEAAGVECPGSEWGLTGRESEVLALLTTGMGNRALSHALSISENTLRSHLKAIFRKLGISNRSQAVALALTDPTFASRGTGRRRGL